MGSHEAKTHLSALPANAKKGAGIIITRQDKPAPKLTMKEWAGWARAFRAKHRLPKGETIKELIEAGRRI